MDIYCIGWNGTDMSMEERIKLALFRLAEVKNEYEVKEPFGEYFRKAASFAGDVYAAVNEEGAGGDLEDRRRKNRELYSEFLPDKYRESYLNPVYAVSRLGEYGRSLSFLYHQLHLLIPFLFEYRVYSHRAEDVAMLLEVLLQVYGTFEAQQRDGGEPTVEEVRQILYWFVSDYADVVIPYRIREQVDPSLRFGYDILMDSDLSRPDYLYEYGEYISEYEEKTAMYLATLPEDKIKSIAAVFTDGYRRGFELTGKDIGKKKTVGLYYRLGFERVLREAVKQFKEMGLESIVFRHPLHLLNGKSDVGYSTGAFFKQCDYDHKEDLALFLDKALNQRRLEILQEAYEAQKENARVYGGPAVLETFGESPFSPVSNNDRCSFNESQEKLATAFSAEAGSIVNRYIPDEERSYTIMSLPDARFEEIFEEIFDRTLELNTLSYKEYQEIQQSIIDVLDPGEKVRVLGCNGNETDLTVCLHRLEDMKKQTQFENCTADVNIPVGEVFTSPVLEGTDGLLHVKSVFLEGLEYRDLRLYFRDGYVTDYSCANFEDKEAGKKYILSNILFNHETLPMAEFAIGTNTLAYAMAKEFGIFDRLQILIAEKTGPHFAVGDTCYSRSEDIAVFNPDGKEIVSKDNSCSLRRKTDPGTAYFNCHTDITLPYDELGSLTVVYKDGSTADIIKDGRFVVPGCERLNEPLENLL